MADRPTAARYACAFPNLRERPTMPPEIEAVDVQKHRRGLSRIWHAYGYSVAGLVTGFRESAAFRQEVLLALCLLPASFWLGQTWVETALLAVVVVLVLITELLNTGIEAAIDRIGPEWHALSKMAKDVGSAAVLLSLLLCGGVWAAALYQRFGG